MPNPTLDNLFDPTSPYYNGALNLDIPPRAENVFSDATGSMALNGPIVGNSIFVPQEKNPLFSVDVNGKMTAQGATILSSRAFTVFEASGRFSQVTSGTGSVTFGINGAVLATGATQSSESYNRWLVNNVDVFQGNPTVSILLTVDTATADANVRSLCIGDVGSTIDLTTDHAGFKIIGTSLYATQGDGTTETASSALTTVANGDLLDLVFKINAASVDYYWRKNVGSFSSVTTLMTNIPNSVSSYMTFVTNNASSATDLGMKLHACSYER